MPSYYLVAITIPRYRAIATTVTCSCRFGLLSNHFLIIVCNRNSLLSINVMKKSSALCAMHSISILSTFAIARRYSFILFDLLFGISRIKTRSMDRGNLVAGVQHVFEEENSSKDHLNELD